MAVKRKKRTDRNHILYRLTLIETGETYIGLSAIIGQAIKGTLEKRWKRHLSRATTESKLWTLHKRLRHHKSPESWEKEILCIVRGRKAAHQREREFIKMLKPELNTF